MTAPKLTLPPELEGLPVIASVSGGKDSTALMLALREASIPFRAVFADTGWEAPETYEYLDYLRGVLGPIDVVGHPGGMVDKCEKRASFPARLQRWCTQELKMKPLRAYHDAIGDDTVSAVGIRHEESSRRASMPELEDDEKWGGWVWRPLVSWTVADVLDIHNRHGVKVNPLYRSGFNRVGCFPCIYSSKEELRLLADHAPDRIDLIRKLEGELTQLRANRNAETPGRYSHEKATFFLTKNGVGPMGIDDIVSWSRTSQGGRQFSLFAPAPRGGCMRWGICDIAPKESDDE